MATLRALLLAGCALAYAGAAPSVRQTQWQRELFARVQESARAASERATPGLLQRMDSEALRAQLAACCPSTRNLTAQQLLARLQADMAAMEVISGFPAVQRGSGVWLPAMSVADGVSGPSFQNMWQYAMRHTSDPASTFRHIVKDCRLATCNMNTGTMHMESWDAAGCTKLLVSNETHLLDRCMHDPGSPSTSLSADFTQNFTADVVSISTDRMWLDEDASERKYFGLRPFQSAGDPQTEAEAAERGPYTLVNGFVLDSGSSLYGDVSAVFSLRAMRESALISAVDSGFSNEQCTTAFAPSWEYHLNCSAYTPLGQLGTMDHYNHLFLTNELFYTETSTLAMRFARGEGQWGQNKMATRHLLKYFEAIPAATLQYPDDVRFLIASFSRLFDAAAPFLGVWARAAGLGNYSVAGRADNATWASMWGGLVDALPALRVRPLRGGDCPRSPDEPECVGVSLDGRCVCYGEGGGSEPLLV